jgi:GDP-mannose 6-dehydrogenase
MATIGIFGLGYVGVVSAGALAKGGHHIIGVDINLNKVETINRGRSPVVEAGMERLIGDAVAGHRLRTTTNAEEAVRGSDMSMVCVGTPSGANGSLDLSQVEKVCQEIGLAMADKAEHHAVVVRSTMLPGSTEELVIPTLEQASGKRAGIDFGVCINPEFLREGSSLKDFYHPAFTLIGGDDDRAIAATKSIYSGLEAPIIVLPIRTAEMVKYACNAFHALKVAFANEIGNICSEQDIDSHEVMEVLCRDTKLNISSAYLKPGFAFGGSCLPKDLRALIYQARRLDVEAPVLEAIMPSNRRQIEKALQMIKRTDRKRIGVLGLSFKAGTDDLRESPAVELIEQLIGKGYEVTVYDRKVSLGNLQGSNRAYIEREIPHIASLMASTLDEVLASSEVIVITNGDTEFKQIADGASGQQVIIDLVGLGRPENRSAQGYQGICW